MLPDDEIYNLVRQIKSFEFDNSLNEKWFADKLNKFDSNNFSKFIDLLLNKYVFGNMPYILYTLFKNDKLKEWSNTNYDKIISCTSQRLLPLILENLAYIPQIEKLINKSEFENSYLSDIIISQFVGKDYEELKKEGLLDFFRELFNELLSVEGLKIKDIEYKAAGATSVVLKIGRMVLKIGRNRFTPQIPLPDKHPDIILIPIIRTPILHIEDEKIIEGGVYAAKNPFCFVEVAQCVHELGYMSKNETKEFISKLENDRLKWKDFFDRNLGRCHEDIVKVYNDYGIESLDLECLGFFSANSSKRKYLVLRDVYSDNTINKIVIIDTDMLYNIEPEVD